MEQPVESRDKPTGDRDDSAIGPNLSSGTARLRRIALAGVILALVLAAGAYAWWAAREQPVKTLTIGAGPYQSDSHELLKEVAEVVERHSSTLRLNLRPTRDSSDNIAQLNEGTIDLATIRSDTPVISNIRLIADLFPDYFQILTAPGSRIFAVNDLVGKRIAIPRFGTDEFRSFWVVSDHYDLPIAGMRWIAVPFAQAADQLLAGEIDAVFTVRSLRDRRLLDLFEDAGLKQIGIRFLEIDQAEAIAVKRPFLGAGRVPKGTFGGNRPTPPRDVVTPTVQRVLVSREDVDGEAIAELTRILFEHRLDLTIRFALASAIQKPDRDLGLSVPLHDGAIRFYTRDEPSFIQENAEPLALMVTLLAMMISGLWALRSRLTVSQKNRMDSYNYVLLDLADRARNAGDPAELAALKRELFPVLETVVRALDTDEVTEEGFQSFSLLWESVRELLNDRLVELQTTARRS